MSSPEELLAAERLRAAAEIKRQQGEAVRQAQELARTDAERARGVAEQARAAVAKEVSETVDNLTALLGRMEAVEKLRRAAQIPDQSE